MTIFLETERLILKQPELADFASILALCSDPHVMKFIGDGTVQAADDIDKFLTGIMAYQAKHGIGFYSVFTKEGREFVGLAGILHLGFQENQPDIEIGYRLHKVYWGKGYATELAKALIRWGFEHLSINKLIAVVHPDNIASQKVLKKAGFDYKGKSKWRNDKEVFWYEIYKNDGIELVSYDMQWPVLAELEIKKLYEVLPKNHILDVQHIGSTAIPGMLAKPIIDIQIAADSLKVFKPIAVDALKLLGYVYWNENPDKERLFFVKGMPPFGEKRTHHVHIVELSSIHWKNKIIFRDYLRSHFESAREYEKLKVSLAAQHTFDREQYTNAKSSFVNKILKNAAETSR